MDKNSNGLYIYKSTTTIIPQTVLTMVEIDSNIMIVDETFKS